MAEMKYDARKFGQKLDISPSEALLDLIQHKAAEVVYWRSRCSELDDLIGLNETEVTDGPLGETRKSVYGEHPMYRTLGRAEKELQSFCTAALRAGIEERQVRVSEALGTQMLGALETVLHALDLSPSQRTKMNEIVPIVLRSLREGESSPRVLPSVVRGEVL